MKNILIILLSAVVVFGCNDLDLAEQGIVVDELPGYVAFDAAGTEVTLDNVAASEGQFTEDNDPNTGDANRTVNLEIPTGTLTDVTVNFTLSGTAIFGTDYRIINAVSATASGGSIIVPADPKDVNQFSNINFYIEFLTDGATDGDKTLTIELTSASNAEGAMAVGRGGTDLLKSVTIDISDID